ncbi:B-4DMT family transporter [Rhodococcus spongiicola]|uniref:B-4DMT family transporter n=1 Tax=Rhodococcus spongiicola TaxID=2487352 RepID=A0A438AXK9_9NOCA|nr:B-4DMT family transporter [Rhodococcus spongiicola]RVW03433.1 hypothetical protein EF834_09885 [Rhodococcus spongiicola]
MNGWVVRGLGLALAYVVVRTFLGAAVTQWPQQGSIMRWFALILVILAAFAWGALDGIRDRRAYPDPDDGADLTMMWLKAAFVTGVLAGALSWFVEILLDIAITNGGLFFEVTSAAAFTVLLVFVPATIAVALGRLFVARETSKSGVPGEDFEDAAAESYAGSEWSYEHGSQSGYDSDAGSQETGDPDNTGADNTRADNTRADNTDTEVFPAVDKDRRPDGADRAEQ